MPVDPPVHVETFASHHSLTWTADGLSRFLRAIEDDPDVPSGTTAALDATDVAGRKRLSVEEVVPDPDVRYLRIEPPTEWTLAWERRTTPVVSLTGTPSASTSRRLHCGTTDCERWDEAALTTARRVLGD